MLFNINLVFLFCIFTFWLDFDFIDSLQTHHNLNFLSYSGFSFWLLSFKSFFFKLVNFISNNYFSLVSFKTLSLNALVFTFKFVLIIALLVFIRGGIPRYRYDFLTKIGWIKFLSLILSMFLSSLLLVYLF